jgi:predicted GIY-YIG superfamily endonuclease
MSFVLYRIFNAENELLYVGATTNPGARYNEHSKMQPWWDQAAMIKLEHLSSHEELAIAEVEAIKSEKPKYNVTNADVPKPWLYKPKGPMGEGYFGRRNDGLWFGQMDLAPGPNGKRRSKRVYSKDRYTALLKFEQLKADIRAGVYT